MQENLFDKVPNGFLAKWQEMADLIAAVIDVPAALIMKTENELMEVFTASKSKENPYTVGDKENWHGLYCETVIKTQKKLSIPNALKDKHWDKNPDIKLGMIAYLGYPINFPDLTPFGTLCVLDNKERHFTAENEKLLLQFKKAIELDLTLILALGVKEDYSHADIIQQLSAYNEEYQASNEELIQANEQLIEAIKKVEESEKKMRSIYSVAPAGIGVVIDRVLKEVNPRICEMTGYAREELLEKNARILYPSQEEYEFVGKEKYAQIKAKGTGEVETLWQKKDGSIINVLLASTPIDLNDYSMGVTFTALDITERKNIENELKEKNSFLSTIMETSPVGIVTVNKSGVITYANKRAEQILGLVKERITSRTYDAPLWNHTDLDGSPLPDEKQPFNIVSKTLNTVFDIQHGITWPDGTVVILSINAAPIKDNNGNFNGMIASIEDISEIKQAGQALKQSEEMMRTSQSVAHICSYSTNLNANKIEESYWVCSPEFYNIFGIDESYPHTIEGWAGFIHPDYREDLVAYHESVVKEKKTFSREYKIIRINDGTERWVHGTGELEFDEKGIPVRMYGAIQDITERKQAQESLLRIEWMLSKKAGAEKSDPSSLYGDLTELNRNRLILDAVGKNMLNDIADDFLRLLETSSAVYEKNGDYAFGIFSSGWCRFMDQASRELCSTDDNAEALSCGKWLCHESCWKEASLPAMESKRPVDIECQGGIHLYAIPILAGGEVIGAINFGYGDPPQDEEKLSELSEKYKVPLDELRKNAREYESRPPYIIDMAKDRLQASANLISEIVSRKITEQEILTLNEQLEQKVAEKTRELKERVAELERFHDATIQREFRIKELRDEIEELKGGKR